MFALAIAVTRQHKFKEAIPILRNATAALPSIPELRKDLAISLIETGEVAEGVSQVASFLKTSATDAEAHYYLGVALRLQNSAEEAQKQFGEALRLEPNNSQYEAAAHPDASKTSTDSVTGPSPKTVSFREMSTPTDFLGSHFNFRRAGPF
jgi:predicted Zn-dependent protease